MIHKTTPMQALVKLVTGVIALPLLFILCAIVAIVGAPLADQILNARDFDHTVWAGSDGMEMDSPRGYMLGDVESFLDEHPTRANVITKLGYADRGDAYYVGFQHSLMGLDPYMLDIKFEHGRAVAHTLSQR